MKPKLTEKISLWQLFILIFVFEIGSAVVVDIGSEAKQDAWIAILLASGIGIALIIFYVFILKKKEGLNLFEILAFCFGKYIGKLLSLLYIIYFFYIAARVMRDFGELIVSTIFEVTPIEILSITIMLVIIYMLYLGIEVLGRTSEIFLPYVFLFILLVGSFILFTGEMHFNNLRPIMADGFGPIIKGIFPSLMTFPFGELVAFMVIIPYVTQFKNAKKVSIYAVSFTGLMLSFTSVILIATLGAEMKGRATFPLLSAAREISLLHFIERVDLVVVFVVMFGIIVKVSILFFAGLKGLEHVFSIPYRMFIFPMATIVAYISIIISHNFAEHIQEGLKFVPFYLHLPFQYVIPMLITPILLWKTSRKAKKVKSNE
ncbi:GerAB/ArcD/ProY family transporter [Bacillus sp. PS06]|uniref:GerAB/ArcD/ProY family transporter n=1 Tax=Bacillus sp. PS06 TaxID=2764176 RepID=UPI00177AEC11|nr:endospore germination permease [Bacillus sp. PS06]MBD8068045.1 endospore germination permease [Bacillus sp. PS06]